MKDEQVMEAVDWLHRGFHMMISSYNHASVHTMMQVVMQFITDVSCVLLQHFKDP